MYQTAKTDSVPVPVFDFEPMRPADIQRLTEDTTYAYDLYISGAMTGQIGHNYRRFNNVADYFRKLGLRVFNPAENFNGRQDLHRYDYLRQDIKNLCRCSAIVLLDEWTESEGAKLEAYVAQELGLEIYHLNGSLLYEKI